MKIIIEGTPGEDRIAVGRYLMMCLSEIGHSSELVIEGQSYNTIYRQERPEPCLTSDRKHIVVIIKNATA